MITPAAKLKFKLTPKQKSEILKSFQTDNPELKGQPSFCLANVLVTDEYGEVVIDIADGSHITVAFVVSWGDKAKKVLEAVTDACAL